MPAAKVYPDGKSWSIGTPDLVVKLPEVNVKGNAPDWWGEIASTPTGLTEDRYVAALEIKEVNDLETSGTGRQTVGGRYVFHHMIWGTRVVTPGQESAAAGPLERRHTVVAGARSGSQRRLFRRPLGAAAPRGIVGGVGLNPSPLERPRHQGAPRDWLQADAERLQAGLPAGR